MTESATVFQYGLELTALVLTATFTVAMWRRRSEPTARPLLGVATLMFAGGVGHVVAVHVISGGRVLEALGLTDGAAPLWAGIAILVVLFAGGFWFLFTLQYTGRSGSLLPMVAAGVVVYWLLVLVGAFVVDVPLDPSGPAGSSSELVLFLAAYLMGGLMTVGAVLVFTTSLRRNGVRVGEAVAFAIGGSLLAFIPIVISNLQDPWNVPVMLSVSTGLLLLAVGRYPAFEAPPVARIAGRDRLIEEIDDPVVVVDRDGRIRDLNPAAEDYLEADYGTVLHETVEEALSAPIDPESIRAAPDPGQIRAPNGATLACSADRIEDARGRSFGHLLVFRDVTERRRRERRSRVLTRLLGGVIADRVAAIGDDAGRITTTGDDDADGTDPAAVGAEIRTETTRLLDIVARTREIERGLTSEPSDPVAVLPVVSEVVDAVQADTDADVAVGGVNNSMLTAMDRRVLETVVEMLLVDGLEDGVREVHVEGVSTDGGPEIHVVERGSSPDDGDGESTEDAGLGARNELIAETTRQMLEGFGGSVSVQKPGPMERRTIVELPETHPDTLSDRSPVVDVATDGETATAGRGGDG